MKRILLIILTISVALTSCTKLSYISSVKIECPRSLMMKSVFDGNTLFDHVGFTAHFYDRNKRLISSERFTYSEHSDNYAFELFILNRKPQYAVIEIRYSSSTLFGMPEVNKSVFVDEVYEAEDGKISAHISGVPPTCSTNPINNQ